MDNNVFDRIGLQVKNAWTSLLMGILYVAVAVCLLLAPMSSYVALSVIFSISILISGLMETLFAISNKQRLSSWGWYLAGGLIDLLLGIYLVVYPLVSMEIIPFLVAFWLMFRGFTLCGCSADLRRYGTREWGWYLAIGILTIVCSVLILWQPGLGAIYLLYMLSFGFLMLGLFRIIFAFELRRLHKGGVAQEAA